MSASTRQAVTAAGPIGRLLVGRIVRLTTTGEHSATTKLRVACVRCKMNDYNAHLKIYFTKQVDHLAVVSNDAPASTSGWEHPTKAALGDHVLMRHLSECARVCAHRVTAVQASRLRDKCNIVCYASFNDTVHLSIR
jgi:hypothetical protein